MGPLKLSFQGALTNHQVLELTDTGNNQETDLIVAIVFNRTSGNGQVTVRVTDANGDPRTLSADLSNGESAKSIVVPVRYFPDDPGDIYKNGVWIQSASATARFSILIATMS